MDDLTKAAAAHRRALERADATRTALHSAILSALSEGRTQADIARATGYTRERLRQIANESR